MGGIEAVMGNIYRTIDRKAFNIDFLFFGHEEEDDSELTKSVSGDSHVFYVPPLREGIWANHAAVEEILRRYQYDIIHTHMDASGAPVLRIAKKCGLAIRIAHSHSTDIVSLKAPKTLKGRIHKLYIEWQRSRITKYATHYVGCSLKAGEWLFGEQVCWQDDFIIFRNAIDAERYAFNPSVRADFRKRYGLEGKKVIGHVGHFSYVKNHPYLIDVFARIHKKDHDIELILIGSGEDMPKIEEQVRELGLSDHVRFLGDQTNVYEWLQCFDLFVMPSRFEGLSVVLVEAQAAGLPCLTSSSVTKESDISGLVEFMDISLDPDVWAQKILQMFKDSRPRVSPLDEIRRKGFDSKTNIKVLEQFYRKCLDDKKGA